MTTWNTNDRRIIAYSNQFNRQPLKGFTSLDLDLLMAIAYKVTNRSSDKVTFTFHELRTLSDLRRNMTDKELVKRVMGVNRKLLSTVCTIKDGPKTIMFALFQTFVADEEEHTLTVSVNPEFSFLFNNLTKEFTRAELGVYLSLASKYAKEFYRRAAQFRSTGKWIIGIDDFRQQLDVPEKYTSGDVNKTVVGGILTELGEPLHLRVERQYRASGPGRPRLSRLTFLYRWPDSQPTSPLLDPMLAQPTQDSTMEAKPTSQPERTGASTVAPATQPRELPIPQGDGMDPQLRQIWHDWPIGTGNPDTLNGKWEEACAKHGRTTVIAAARAYMAENPCKDRNGRYLFLGKFLESDDLIGRYAPQPVSAGDMVRVKAPGDPRTMKARSDTDIISAWHEAHENVTDIAAVATLNHYVRKHGWTGDSITRGLDELLAEGRLTGGVPHAGR